MAIIKYLLHLRLDSMSSMVLILKDYIMRHIKKNCKTAIVAWVSLCLMVLIATSCRTVDKSVQSVQGVDLVQVSGTVLNENNEPLIGATVVQQNNPKNGMPTDIDGHFTLNVPADTKIKVTYVGYKDAIVVSKDGMTIKLKRDPNYKEEHLIVR